MFSLFTFFKRWSQDKKPGARVETTTLTWWWMIYVTTSVKWLCVSALMIGVLVTIWNGTWLDVGGKGAGRPRSTSTDRRAARPVWSRRRSPAVQSTSWSGRTRRCKNNKVNDKAHALRHIHTLYGTYTRFTAHTHTLRHTHALQHIHIRVLWPRVQHVSILRLEVIEEIWTDRTVCWSDSI